MGNSYPFKIGTKLGDCLAPDYRPDGRVRPGHLTGLKSDRHFEDGENGLRHATLP
jgi:hypothetical protein